MTRNESHNELTAKQNAAICALLNQPTIKAAAEASKISEASLYRWLATPAFSIALKDARDRALEAALSALQGASGKAVETLYEIMGDASAQASTRVSAAKTVLDMMIKAHDILVNEERLRVVELRLLALNNE
jgi:hypothetical protein